MTPVLSTEGVCEIFNSEFPELSLPLVLEEVTQSGMRVRLDPDETHLRPGGTVSGPSMFALADLAMYAALLSRIGKVPLAVTTNAQIDFMRKPAAGKPILAEVTLQKVGRTLAVGHIVLRNPGSDDVLAQSSMTYSIPPRSD